jgi:malate synthase
MSGPSEIAIELMRLSHTITEATERAMRKAIREAATLAIDDIEQAVMSRFVPPKVTVKTNIDELMSYTIEVTFPERK